MSMNKFASQNNLVTTMTWLMTTYIVLALSGCGAVHTMVKKRNLDVQTKMSETIFLEPSVSPKRNIFLSVRNTSDKTIDIKSQIAETLEQNGYSIVKDPKQANFMLQANVLQCGKTDLRTAQSALASGFGGGVVGAGVAAVAGGTGRQVGGAGLFGAAAGVVGDALVDDTLFSMITDLQVRERPLEGEVVVQTQDTHAKQGTSSYQRQYISGAKVNWRTYRTRIVSTANKANLKFPEAQPVLEDGLVRSISGIFMY